VFGRKVGTKLDNIETCSWSKLERQIQRFCARRRLQGGDDPKGNTLAPRFASPGEMTWTTAVWWTAVAIASVVAVSVLLRVVWRVHGQWRIRRAGPRTLIATRHRLWREPSRRDLTDLRYGPGGADSLPVAPFAYMEEHLAGSQPCVAVRDARGRLWRVKWGYEAKPESFAVRFASALGYFAEVTHYVPHGRIEGASRLSRARSWIADDGTFEDARFELEDQSVRMFFDEHSWSWDDNPFVGTKQLNGLKIVNMLLSNWDTKDRRDVSRGSNTAIFEHRVGRWGREARYLITDWGGAMGKWGSNVVSRGRWDVNGFEAQTPRFVTEVRDGFVCFAYQGQRTAEIARGITLKDAAWFYDYACRLTEPALRDGLLACGATPEEATRFAHALLDRIRQIGEACGEVARATETTKTIATKAGQGVGH
jgi:hypothetical protein